MKCYFCGKETKSRARIRIRKIGYTMKLIPLCIECLTFFSDRMKDEVEILEILVIKEGMG